MNLSTVRGLASVIIPCWSQLEYTRQCIAAGRPGSIFGCDGREGPDIGKAIEARRSYKGKTIKEF